MLKCLMAHRRAPSLFYMARACRTSVLGSQIDLARRYKVQRCLGCDRVLHRHLVVYVELKGDAARPAILLFFEAYNEKPFPILYILRRTPLISSRVS